MRLHRVVGREERAGWGALTLDGFGACLGSLDTLERQESRRTNKKTPAATYYNVQNKIKKKTK